MFGRIVRLAPDPFKDGGGLLFCVGGFHDNDSRVARAFWFAYSLEGYFPVRSVVSLEWVREDVVDFLPAN